MMEKIIATTEPDDERRFLWQVTFRSSYYDNDPRGPSTVPIEKEFYVLAGSKQEALGKVEDKIIGARKGCDAGAKESITAAIVTIEELVPTRDRSSDGRVGLGIAHVPVSLACARRIPGDTVRLSASSRSNDGSVVGEGTDPVAMKMPGRGLVREKTGRTVADFRERLSAEDMKSRHRSHFLRRFLFYGSALCPFRSVNHPDMGKDSPAGVHVDHDGASFAGIEIRMVVPRFVAFDMDTALGVPVSLANGSRSPDIAVRPDLDAGAARERLPSLFEVVHTGVVPAVLSGCGLEQQGRTHAVFFGLFQEGSFESLRFPGVPPFEIRDQRFQSPYVGRVFFHRRSRLGFQKTVMFRIGHHTLVMP